MIFRIDCVMISKVGNSRCYSLQARLVENVECTRLDNKLKSMFSFLRKIFIRVLFFGGLIIALIIFFKIDNSKLQSGWSKIDFLREKIARYTSRSVDNREDNQLEQNVQDKIVKNENKENDEQKEFSGTEDDLIVLINKERLEKQLKPVKKNSLLMLSAKDKALDMVAKKYFEHISDKRIQPWFFAEKNSYRYQSFAENIATDYLSAKSVHRAFMDSDGHRANILNDDFRDVGIAIVPMRINDKINYVVVEHFGSYLKDPDLTTGYGRKNKLRCKVQKKKRKELLKMIHWQREHNPKSKFLPDLEKIKEEIDLYLEGCNKLKNTENLHIPKRELKIHNL